MAAEAIAFDSDSFVDPQAPNDDLSFESLAAGYNFRKTSIDARVFTRLIIKECDKQQGDARVLDIGCGRGIARKLSFQRAVRKHAHSLWGLEPNPDVSPEDNLFDRYECSTMEDADLPAHSVNVSYSSMVMEHVVDPDQFLASLFRCLEPGGTYLFITPNGRHYFTRIASLLHRLRADETVLRLIRKKEKLQRYHYPVHYRFNSERQIAACAERAGFLPPEFCYLEAQGPKNYFPRPLRFIFYALAAKRRFIRNPRNLVAMVGRLTKPVS